MNPPLPGTGTVSRPTPHTAEKVSRSLSVKVGGVCAALSARTISSMTGSMSPLYPMVLMPFSGRLFTALVTADTADRVPNSPDGDNKIGLITHLTQLIFK